MMWALAFPVVLLDYILHGALDLLPDVLWFVV